MGTSTHFSTSCIVSTNASLIAVPFDPDDLAPVRTAAPALSATDTWAVALTRVAVYLPSRSHQGWVILWQHIYREAGVLAPYFERPLSLLGHYYLPGPRDYTPPLH
jgi:hypothetical protein